MMKLGLGVAAAVFAAGSVASATPVLQMDLNSFSTQAKNSSGASSPFGGLSHTGAVNFSLGAGVLNGLFIQSVANGPFANANFAGFTLSNFAGSVILNNGQVTGGSITVTINNNDSYTCNITPGSGAVSTYVGGGYKIEALTKQGFFNDSQFGNVNVNPWFSSQGLSGLFGSFLQFNFNPNANGAASSDMDLFVDASPLVPLPPAAWAGLATMGGAMVIRRIRRR